MPSDDNLLLYRRAGTGLPKSEIRRFAGILQSRLAVGRSFTCMLTDDRELERLNRVFLGKAYPTDILSFPSGGDKVLGELAISVDRARQQASDHGHELVEEIKILMLHGVLHLLGLDHETDRGTMAKAEKRWRSELGLPQGLIERTKPRKQGAER